MRHNRNGVSLGTVAADLRLYSLFLGIASDDAFGSRLESDASVLCDTGSEIEWCIRSKS